MDGLYFHLKQNYLMDKRSIQYSNLNYRPYVSTINI